MIKKLDVNERKQTSQEEYEGFSTNVPPYAEGRKAANRWLSCFVFILLSYSHGFIFWVNIFIQTKWLKIETEDCISFYNQADRHNEVSSQHGTKENKASVAPLVIFPIHAGITFTLIYAIENFKNPQNPLKHLGFTMILMKRNTTRPSFRTGFHSS